MSRWTANLVLLLGLIVPACSADSMSTERRLSTLEEQRRNQVDWNDGFDKRLNGKIDDNDRRMIEHFAALERSQGAQDSKVQSLMDTKNIATWLKWATPLALGCFYFLKGPADKKRNEAILATENRIHALEVKEKVI